jgi:ribosomal protein L37AE/L43A
MSRDLLIAEAYGLARLIQKTNREEWRSSEMVDELVAKLGTALKGAAYCQCTGDRNSVSVDGIWFCEGCKLPIEEGEKEEPPEMKHRCDRCGKLGGQRFYITGNVWHCPGCYAYLSKDNTNVQLDEIKRLLAEIKGCLQGYSGLGDKATIFQEVKSIADRG